MRKITEVVPSARKTTKVDGREEEAANRSRRPSARNSDSESSLLCVAKKIPTYLHTARGGGGGSGVGGGEKKARERETRERAHYADIYVLYYTTKLIRRTRARSPFVFLFLNSLSRSRASLMRSFTGHLIISSRASVRCFFLCYTYLSLCMYVCRS